MVYNANMGFLIGILKNGMEESGHMIFIIGYTFLLAPGLILFQERFAWWEQMVVKVPPQL